MALTDTLHTTLQNRLTQTGGGNLKVNSTDFAGNSGDFTAIIGADNVAFTGATLALNGAALTLSGTTNLWGVKDKVFRFNIEEQAGGLVFTLYPVAFNTGWKLSDGFSRLQHGLFDILLQTEVTLVAASYDRDFGNPVLALKKGLNYAAKIAAPNSQPPLKTLMPTATLLQGLITRDNDRYKIDIQATLPGNKTFTPFGFDPFTMSGPLDIHVVSNPAGNDGASQETIFLKGTVQQGALNFPGILHLPTSYQQPVYALEPQQLPLELPTIDHVLGLAAGDDFTTVFPAHFKVLDKLLISAYKVNFQTETPAFASIFTTFALKLDANGQPRYWQLLSSPNIAIGDLSVAFNPAYYAYGTNQKQLAFSTTFAGHIKMGQGKVNLGVLLFVPLSGTWVLELTNFPKLSDLAGFIWPQHDQQKILGTLPESMVSTTGPDLQIKDLQIGFNPRTPSFDFVSFVLSQEGVWDIGGIGLQVSGWSVAFKVDAKNNNQISGLIQGKLKIGSVPDIKANFPIPAENGRWTIGLEEGTSIQFPNIGELLTTIGGVSTGAGLPQGLTTFGNFAVSQLAIVFSPKPAKLFRLTFGMLGTADWIIQPNFLVVKAVKAYLDLHRKADDSGYESVGFLQGTVAIFRHDVQLKAYKQNPQDAWKLQILLQTPILIPGLTDLAGWMLPGDMVRFIPPELMPFGKGFLLTDLNINFNVSTHQLDAIDFRIENAEPWLIFHNKVSVDKTFVKALVTKTGQANPESAVHIEGIINIAQELVVKLQADKTKAQLGAVGAKPSWTFSGTLVQPFHIGKLIAYIGQKFDIPETNFPEAVREITVTTLTVTYKTGDQTEFFFECAGRIPFGEASAQKELDIDLKIAINNKGNDAKNQPQFERILNGDFVLKLDNIPANDLRFRLLFDQTQSGSGFSAAYTGQREIVLQQIIGKLSAELGAVFPESFKITVKNAFFVVSRNNTPPASTKILFGIGVGATLNLANLPLVGKAFPSDKTIGVENLQWILAAQPFSTAEVQVLQTSNLIPVPISPIPATGLAKGLAIFATLNIGGSIQSVALPVTAPAPVVPPQPNTPVPAPPPDNAKWFTIQKSIGPVYFEKVGAEYDEGALWFLLTASMTTAGLTLSLDGLSAGSSLKAFKPEFRLRGLGVDFKQGPVEIAGGFLRQRVTPAAPAEPYDEYDGLAMLKVKTLSLTAIGSYAWYQGHPSLFIYAVLDYPIGGPAFFFVTGLAAGFGYNRSLRMPDITQVAQFPLVVEATTPPPAPLANTSSQAISTTISQKLGALQRYIPPTPGQYFLAIGIKFTSFKIVDSFALLAISFGQHFEVDLLGVSTAVLPPRLTGDNTPALAVIQMALKAVFQPEEGFLGVEAQLTAASYLFSRSCHITGGFAFYVWFKQQEHNPQIQAGEFVLSIGGYHPNFKVPDYYPVVPRLGLNWQITDNLSIRGGLYFALAPHVLMAGGNLEAVWADGSLRASFRVGADFIIYWKPYHYDAHAYININVDYTFHFFGTHHISVDAGADLHIWGPDFSGTARVHLWIVSFEVSFGSLASNVPAPIGWDEFKKSFLPLKKSNPALIDAWSMRTAGGLVKTLQGAGNSGQTWIVNPKELAFAVESAIPLTALPAGLTAVTLPGDLGIAPMNSANLVSTIEVVVKRNGVVATNDFALTNPILKNMPAALWGKKLSSDLNGKKFVQNTLCGFEIRPKQAVETTHTNPIDQSNLQFSTDGINNAFAYGKASKLTLYTDQSRSVLKNTALSQPVTTQRNAILQALGFQQPNQEVALRADWENMFLETPQLLI